MTTREEVIEHIRERLLVEFGPYEADIVAEFGQDMYDALVADELPKAEEILVVRFVRALP